jgi:hypothetical protein
MSGIQLSQEAIDAVHALRDVKGHVTAIAVLMAARDPDSPLHEFFEWDDIVAAEKERLEQAKRIVKSIRVAVQVGPTVVHAPGYLPVPNKVATYQPTEAVQPGSDEAREIVLAELGRIGHQLERTSRIAAVIGAPVTTDLDQLVAMISALKGRI